MTSFEGEKMQIQYNVLGCRIVLCLHEYKLAIEIHENGLTDRNIDYEKGKKQKNKNLAINLSELIQTKNILIFSKLLMKYVAISKIV